MAEFGFLTRYIYADGIEEININSWKDTKITYADGRVVPSKERFQSPSTPWMWFAGCSTNPG